MPIHYRAGFGDFSEGDLEIVREYTTSYDLFLKELNAMGSRYPGVVVHDQFVLLNEYEGKDLAAFVRANDTSAEGIVEKFIATNLLDLRKKSAALNELESADLGDATFEELKAKVARAAARGPVHAPDAAAAPPAAAGAAPAAVPPTARRPAPATVPPAVPGPVRDAAPAAVPPAAAGERRGEMPSRYREKFKGISRADLEKVKQYTDSVDDLIQNANKLAGFHPGVPVGRYLDQLRGSDNERLEMIAKTSPSAEGDRVMVSMANQLLGVRKKYAALKTLDSVDLEGVSDEELRDLVGAAPTAVPPTARRPERVPDTVPPIFGRSDPAPKRAAVETKAAPAAAAFAPASPPEASRKHMENIVNSYEAVARHHGNYKLGYSQPEIDKGNGRCTLKFPDIATRDKFLVDQAKAGRAFVALDPITKCVIASSDGKSGLKRHEGNLSYDEFIVKKSAAVLAPAADGPAARPAAGPAAAGSDARSDAAAPEDEHPRGMDRSS